MLRQVHPESQGLHLKTAEATGEAAEAGPKFSRRQRLQIRAASWVGFLVIGIIGRTLRWESSGVEGLDAIHASGRRAIFTFWHGRIFPATWYWRRRGIVVMTSLNYDGEIIAGSIRRHGYGAARGSSSRGGFRALAEMARDLRAGRDVAFTIDGPRGPRYVAKQGPVILARKTGAAVFCFHIAMKWKIELNSWDRFQIPLPFTPAHVFAGPPIWVPADSTEDQVRELHQAVQRCLDSLRAQGEAWERSG